MVRKTVGVDPKVPVQAITTVVWFLATYFGLDLDAEVAGAVAVLIGLVAGYFSPAATTTLQVKE